MSSHDGALLALEIAVMLSIALASGQTFRWLGLPVVIGEIVGGILIGPTVLGALIPTFEDRLFPAAGPVATGRGAITFIGLLCFLFAAGLEVDLGQIRRTARTVVLTSLLGIAVPFVSGVVLVYAAPDYWSTYSPIGKEGLAVLLGTALSISALPVIARTLMDLGLQRSEVGSVVLAAATIDDVLGWSMFGSILAGFAPDHPGRHDKWLTLVFILAIAALSLTAGRAVARRFRPVVWRALDTPGGHIRVALILALLSGVLAEWLGVHAIVGAFLAGVVLAEGRADRGAMHEVVYQFAMGVFAPIYFVSIGLRANFLSSFDLVLSGIVLVVACLGKIIGVTVGARLGGMPLRSALAVAFGMNARGAMEIVLASVAHESGLVDERLFVALVITAILTSLLSGPIMVRLLGRTPAR
jgi:Kef-type K+ transport system membrane component KefB